MLRDAVAVPTPVALVGTGVCFPTWQAIELESVGDDGMALGVHYPVGGFGEYRDALLRACEAAGAGESWGQHTGTRLRSHLWHSLGRGAPALLLLWPGFL